MDTNTLLIFIIALLTINLLFVGVYIVLVLKDVRNTLQKVNTILDTANEVSVAVANPLLSAAAAISAAVESFKALKIIKSLSGRKESKYV
ncbi:MAG: hypothetical protein Q8N84_01530 [bacterium]|nr:hypothetical protein [bacterium]